MEAFIALGPSNVAVMIFIAIGLLAAGHWSGYEPGYHQAALMEVRRQYNFNQQNGLLVYVHYRDSLDQT
jgi:hypothetical protein